MHGVRAGCELSFRARCRGRLHAEPVQLQRDGRELHKTVGLPRFALCSGAVPVSVSGVEVVPLLRGQVWHLRRKAQHVMEKELDFAVLIF